MPSAVASIYVIGAEVGPRKIGVSWSPVARLRQLRRLEQREIFVQWEREYPRDAAFHIEGIIKRDLSSFHLGKERYDMSLPEAIESIFAAEEVYRLIEIPRSERARRLDARRVELGLTKRKLSSLIGMTENNFNAAFSAAHRGKLMDRAPDLLDQIEVHLSRLGGTANSCLVFDRGLTREMNSGDIRHSGGLRVASREPIEGSRPRQ